METNSAQCRKKGNAVFKSIQRGTMERLKTWFKPEIIKEKLEEALSFYNQALSRAFNKEDKIAASKNIGVASSKMHEFLYEHNADDKLIEFYFSETIKHTTVALDLGNEHPEEWKQRLRDAVGECVERWLKIMEKLPSEGRILGIEKFIEKVPLCAPTSKINFMIADARFKTAVKKQDLGEHKESLRFLKECYRPLETAKRHGDLHTELRPLMFDLEEDVFIQTCVAESCGAIATGNQLLGTALLDEENLNMDLIYDVIDWYQQAIILARGKDLENEAIANSHLGRIYKAMQFKDKAKERFIQSVRLANSLQKSANVFIGKDWYETAKQAVERYQLEAKLAMEKEWEHQRKKYVAQLKDELAEFQTACTAAGTDYSDKAAGTKLYGLLEFTYKRFPPKNTNFKLMVVKFTGEYTKESKVSLKKAFQKAVTHYHPDRQKEEDGLKWKVLAEEICKILTRRYEMMKDISLEK